MLKRFFELQKRVKAPKSEKNTYGQGYKYRNLEKMLEANAPVFEEFKVSIVFVDDVVAFGERLFLKSSIVVSDEDPESENFGDTVSADGWAEIPMHLATMSAPQITGSASSYARKYAFCNLFAIDGSEDVDALRQETLDERLNAAIKAVNDAVAQKDVDNFKNVVMSYWKEYSKTQKFVDVVNAGKAQLGIVKSA